MTTLDMERYNPNYIGGDINGGVLDLAQLFTRPTVFVTSMEAGGTEPLRELLRDRVRAQNREVDILLPVTGGGMLAEIYREGEVLDREDEGTGITLRARIPDALLGRLKQQPGVQIHDGA